MVGEGRDGGRQVGGRARVGVEVAEPGGDEQNERHVEVVGENAAARVERLDYQQVVRRPLQSVTITTTPVQSDIAKNKSRCCQQES